jgi:hypothetical protein
LFAWRAKLVSAGERVERALSGAVTHSCQHLAIQPRSLSQHLLACRVVSWVGAAHHYGAEQRRKAEAHNCERDHRWLGLPRDKYQSSPGGALLVEPAHIADEDNVKASARGRPAVAIALFMMTFHDVRRYVYMTQ